MVKIFRPFWSYDVERTEEWLSSVAKQGYHLVKINTWTRQFYFEEGSPKTITYKIGFDKGFHSLPAALADEGWEEVYRHQHWYVLSNESPLEEINVSPVQEGLINHNKKVMYVFTGILLYMILTSLLPLFLTGYMLFTDGAITVYGSPMWIVTITVGVSIWTLIIYSTVKLYKTNKRLEFGTSKQIVDKRSRRKEESRLKKSGEMIKRRKPGWMYSADKLGHWLETMEEQGLNLHRINKLGTAFFFIKGEPRNVSYVADYQNNTDKSYFDMHQEAGWTLMYTSNAFLSKWSIWAHIYEEGEAQPELYSDSTHMLKHARRVAITYSAFFGSFILMLIGVIALNLNLAVRSGMDELDLLLFILQGILIAEFGMFIVKSLLYYRRVKRDIEYS